MLTPDGKGMQQELGPESRYGQARLLAPPLGVVAVLVAASFFTPVAPAGPGIPHFDKVAHFLVFGLVGTLLFRALPLGFFAPGRWFAALAGALAIGAADEIMQLFNPARSFDSWDWVADGAGALLAILLYRNWGLYRKVLEWPLRGRS